MKQTRIEWNKMHTRNYDGTCKECGGHCVSTESVENWVKATGELAKAKFESNKQRINYLSKKIDEKWLYFFLQD